MSYTIDNKDDKDEFDLSSNHNIEDTKEYNVIIQNLKFFASIQPGHKINANDKTTISSNGAHSALYRWTKSESRTTTLELLNETIKVLAVYLYTNKDNVPDELITYISNAIDGINILKKTYESLDSSSKFNDLENVIKYFNRLKFTIEND